MWKSVLFECWNLEKEQGKKTHSFMCLICNQIQNSALVWNRFSKLQITQVFSTPGSHLLPLVDFCSCESWQIKKIKHLWAFQQSPEVKITPFIDWAEKNFVCGGKKMIDIAKWFKACHLVNTGPNYEYYKLLKNNLWIMHVRTWFKIIYVV